MLPTFNIKLAHETNNPVKPHQEMLYKPSNVSMNERIIYIAIMIRQLMLRAIIMLKKFSSALIIWLLKNKPKPTHKMSLVFRFPTIITRALGRLLNASLRLPSCTYKVLKSKLWLFVTNTIQSFMHYCWSVSFRYKATLKNISWMYRRICIDSVINLPSYIILDISLFG